MADQKISEFNNITGADVDDSTDELAIVDTSANETKAITRGELFNSLRHANVYQTRTEAISALSSLPVGSFFFVEDLLFERVSSSSTVSDMPNVEPRGNVTLLHWKAVTTNNVSDNDQAIIQAIAWLNGDGKHLHLPAGNVTFGATWPAITATGFTISGPDTQLVINSGAGTGTLVVFGDASNVATNGRFIVTHCTTNDTTANEHFFRFDQSMRVRVETAFNNANGIAKFGSSHGPAKQTEFFANGNFTRGATSNEAFLFEDATTIRIGGIYNCAADCTSNANGAYIRMKPISGGIVDTVKMEGCGFVSGTGAAGGSDENGKNYGLVIDMTDAPVTNISCDDFTFFDHTVLIGFHMLDTGADNGYARAIHLGGVRLGACYGKGAVLDKNSSVASVWGGIHLNDMDIFLNGSGNNEGVNITGVGYLNCHITGCTIGDNGTAGTIDRAILANSDGWIITGNSIGTNVNNTTDFARGVQVSNADVEDIIITNNRCDPTIANPIAVPVSWTNPDTSCPGRVISKPENAASKVVYDIGTRVISSGAVTINGPILRVDTEASAASDDLDTINGGVEGQIVIVVPNADTRTVVAKDNTGNLRLNGDFTMDSGNDTLTLMYLNAVWREISRSDNAA